MYASTLLDQENDDYYKYYKNVLTTTLRKAKSDYFYNTFNDCAKNTKKTWKHISNILNNKKNTSFPAQINVGAGSVSDALDMANVFNDYFVNVGPNLADKISSTTDPGVFLGDSFTNTMFFIPVTNHEIDKLIDGINCKKAIGYDDIHPRLIKDSKMVIVPLLSHIANLMLQKGKFPNSLKIAQVLPLYKAGDPACVSNYRPISILTVFSKLFELIIKNKLVNFLTTFKILSPEQYGFRKNVSTKQALINFIEELYLNKESSFDTIGVFLDLSKAFDTVDHNILIKKLQHYGIRGVCLDLFQSYLSERRQLVNIYNNNSGLKPIKCGVPQGSILGPILFILYINDLPDILKFSKIKLYADDTTIACCNSDHQILETSLNSDLEVVSLWFQANKLTLNTSKSNYCVFYYKKNITFNFTVKIGNIVLNEKSYVKYLGVIIDNKLAWNHHVNHVLSKVSKYVGIFFKLSHYVPRNILLLLYNSLVYPHFTYAVEILG